MFAEGGDEGDGAGVLGRDAVGDGGGDADDFLEHLDEGVVFVLAGFDLAGFHAEGGFEVHPLQSAGRKLVTDPLQVFLGEERKGREGKVRGRFTCMVWWRCAA